MSALRSAVAAVALGIPAAAAADPPVACHCFRDRAFDPAAPAAADPYILATTRSSLLSAAFGVGKGDLVRAVMGGTPPDDLWVAHSARARTGMEVAALLDARRTRGTWSAALVGVRGLGPALEAAIARRATDAEIASVAVDDVLVARLRVDPESLAALHAAGARSDEAILASFLAPRLGTLPPLVLGRVRTGKATWGTELRDARLTPDEIDRAVRVAAAGHAP